jgi:sulfotransferase family protein
MTSTRHAPSDSSRATVPAGQISVVYVIGLGRSGSTLLGNLLGELEGFFHAGELRTIWARGLRGRRLCGCGFPLDKCPLWSEILTRGFGVLEGASDPRRVVELQRQVLRGRHTPRLLRQLGKHRSRWPALDAYASIATRLYQSIAQVTGAHVIVDSSKRPTDAMLLGLLASVEPYFVHLVRDPRAVAYSWRRHKESPGDGRREEMLRYGTVTSSRNWLWVNAAAEAVRRRHEHHRSVLLRYEDFVRWPRATVELIAGLASEYPTQLPFIDDRTVRLRANHTAGGNPIRLLDRPVSISEDDEWLTHQPVMDRVIATVISSPLLRRYGYALQPETTRVLPAAD